MSKPDNFPVGTVIHGTHRNYDLFHAFTEFWNCHIAVDPEAYIEVDLFNDWVPDRNPYWDTEDATEMVEWLFRMLDSAAPDGYYFGAHPGDGSDFGFWEVESLEQA